MSKIISSIVVMVAVLWSSFAFSAEAVYHEPVSGFSFIPLGHRSSGDIVSPELHEEVLKMRVAVKDLYRDKVEGDIDVTLYRPDGDGPFPLVVINHGRPAHAEEARKYPSRIHDVTNAKFWIRKGFAVAIPTRLGYGDTYKLGDPEWEGPVCSVASYDAAYRNAAEQVRQTVELVVSKKSWVDANNIVLLGYSAGGSAVIAAAAQNIPGVKAVINVSGGWGGNPTAHPGDPCGETEIYSAMRRYGKTTTVPELWLYSQNDLFFSTRWTKRWAEAFNNNGGNATYVEMPAFEDNGHFVYGHKAGQALWEPEVDKWMMQFGYTAIGYDPTVQQVDHTLVVKEQ